MNKIPRYKLNKHCNCRLLLLLFNLFKVGQIYNSANIFIIQFNAGLSIPQLYNSFENFNSNFDISGQEIPHLWTLGT